MAKTPVELPQIVVRQQVEIEIPSNEVEHIIRCWVAHSMAGVPKPAQFAKIQITFISGDDSIYSATARYEPVTPPAFTNGQRTEGE